MPQSVYFALMLASYGSVGATGVQQICANQKSDQYCQAAVSGSTNLCPDLFCPACIEAGSCDFTCGFCQTTTMASTSTSTTTALPCLSVNVRDDAVCESSITLCEYLFCPSCVEAGQCDRTCKWCSTPTTLSSTGTSITVSVSSTTSTFTSTSKTGILSSATSTTSSTSTSASETSVASMPTANSGPEGTGDLRGTRPAWGDEVPIGVLLVVFLTVCAASLCQYWWHRKQAPQRRPRSVEPGASIDNEAPSVTVGISPTYPCEADRKSPRSVHFWQPGEAEGTTSPRSVHFWQPGEAEGTTGLVPMDVSASFDDDQARSYTDEPFDDATLECYAWDTLVCTQNVGTHAGTCTHRGFNCSPTGSGRLSRAAESGRKSPRSSRPATENESMQAAEQSSAGLEELREATGVHDAVAKRLEL